MIDERAIIADSATIAADVFIGPWVKIGGEVTIESGVRIEAHAVIESGTVIGKETHIYPFTMIGGAPQHLEDRGQETHLEIGARNVIREYSSIHRGTNAGGGVTRIGDDNLFMAYSHVAHDCTIGNHVVFVNNASLAGHVTVGDYAVLGGFTAVHQFCTIGAHSFLSRSASIAKDVLPFFLVAGNPAQVYGLNKVGLRRRQFNEETLKGLMKAYKIISRQGVPIAQVINQLRPLVSEYKEVGLLLEALIEAKRGVLR